MCIRDSTLMEDGEDRPQVPCIQQAQRIFIVQYFPLIISVVARKDFDQGTFSAATVADHSVFLPFDKTQADVMQGVEVSDVYKRQAWRCGAASAARRRAEN